MANGWTQETFIKRAGKACLSCRARKIRCNVEQTQPCSNCLTDELDCQTRRSMRGKKPSGKPRAKRKPLKTTNNTSQDTGAINSRFEDSKAVASFCRISPAHTTRWLDNGVEWDVFSQCQKEAAAEKSNTSELDHRFLHQELSYVSLVGRATTQYTTTADLTPPNETILPQDSWAMSIAGLPEFIRPLSDHLTSEDIDYLRIKGALDIPSSGFLKALINSYIQFVYPCMPATDLSTIVGIVNGENMDISILLLQAIAFSAVAFVDISEIRRAGFESRRSCRKSFYDKVRVLYNFDVESDKLAIIQAVLLMAYWNETPGDNKGAWHWLGVAVSHAQMLGMHRRSEYKVQSSQAKLHKRVWWSCYIRDRMLAIAMGRPLRIKNTEFDTEPLSLEDFDIPDLPSAKGNFIIDKIDQTTLAKICIKAAELCRLVTGVIELHFTVLSSGHSTSTSKENNGMTATMLFLNAQPPSEQLIQWYDEQLQIWYMSLPSSCIYGTNSIEGCQSPCVTVNAAWLYITFWAVVSALHRPQLRNGLRAISFKRIEEAALRIAKVDREMHRIGLDQYLPATGIPFQFPTFITLTKRLKHQKPSDVTMALESLFYCIKVVETLRESFVGGDHAIKLLWFVARKSELILLQTPDLKLSGIEYQGSSYSPELHQHTLDSASSSVEFGEDSPNQNLCQSGFESDVAIAKDGNVLPQNDEEPPSFDNMDAIDWNNLSDILPAYDMDFEHSFSGLINLDYIQDR